jgi:hypothetical protein
MAAYTTINKPSLHFNTKLYTGNGGTQSITGVGFQPDWTWIKKRSGVGSHSLFDSVRGVTKLISSNTTNAEATLSGGLTAFGTDGFTVGSDGDVNGNSATYVSWNWKANGAGSSNTDGSINTTATSVNTTAGFSISTYEGTGSAATVGHGLGVTPAVVLVKNIDASQNWLMYHQGIGATKYARLNLSNGQGTSSGPWNNTAPTSSVFSIGADGAVTGSGQTHVAYCFSEVRGYSRFGYYTGNNNADGPYVYTGFKPAFVLIKNTADSADWTINDTARNPENVNNLRLFPNTNVSENSGSNSMDMYSNGFKLRSTDGGNNGNGHVMIYMAFAENPLVDSTGKIPATAR